MYDILYPIIEHYIGIRVVGIERDEEIVQFKTLLGQGGKIERNPTGDWDLLIDEEKVAEIEDVLFSIFCEAKKQPPIDKYYKKLLKLKKKGRKYRSDVLVEQLLLSIEFLLLNAEVKINKPISLGEFFIFSLNGKKEIIVLN